MKRTIKFNGYVGRWDTPSFLIADNEGLEIEINLAETVLGKHILTAISGDNITRLVYEGKNFYLPPELLTGDLLELHLDLFTKEGDRVIIPSSKSPKEKGYFIEPLKFIKTTEEMFAVGWFSSIEERQAKIEEEQARINARLNEFEGDGVPLIFE